MNRKQFYSPKVFLICFIVLVTAGIFGCEPDEVKPSAPAAASAAELAEFTFGGSGLDQLFDIQWALDGGYLAVGSSTSSDGDVPENKGKTDLWLVRLNADFQVIWSKTFGSSGYDAGLKIAATQDAKWYVAGYCGAGDGDTPDNKGKSDMWILKVDDEGTMIWSKTLGGIGNDEAHGIAVTTDGGCAVTGYYTANKVVPRKSGKQDMYIAKLNAEGKFQWGKKFGGTKADFGEDIAVTFDGNYVVGGYSNSNDGDVPLSQGGHNYWFVILDSVGEKKLSRTYGGSQADILSSMKVHPAKGFLLSGSTRSTDGDIKDTIAGKDAWVLRLDDKGEILSSKVISKEGDQVSNDIAPSLAGGFFIGGASTKKSWVAKCSAEGALLSERLYGKQGKNIIYAVEELGPNNFLLAGSSEVIEQDTVQQGEGWAGYLVLNK